MEKLVVLTMFYGGKMQRMLDSSVTHLVTMEASGVRQCVHVYCTVYCDLPSYPRPTSGNYAHYMYMRVHVATHTAVIRIHCDDNIMTMCTVL